MPTLTGINGTPRHSELSNPLGDVGAYFPKVCNDLEALVNAQRNVDEQLTRLGMGQGKIIDMVTDVRRDVLEVGLELSRGIVEKTNTQNGHHSPRRGTSLVHDAFAKRVSVSLEALSKSGTASLGLHENGHKLAKKSTRIRNTVGEIEPEIHSSTLKDSSESQPYSVHQVGSMTSAGIEMSMSSSVDSTEDIISRGGISCVWPKGIIIRDCLNVSRHHKELEELITKRSKKGLAPLSSRIRDSLGTSDMQPVSSVRSARYSSEEEAPPWHLTSTSSFTSRILPPHQKCMLKPSHGLRIAVDALSIVTLAFDLFTIPFVLAWDAKVKGFLKYGMLSVCVFWTFDLFLTFRTGYFDHGDLEMKPDRVAWHYMKTWLIPDLALVACDWTNIVIGIVAEDTLGSAKGFTLLRFLKAGRLLRVLGVVRLAKLTELFERMASMSSLDTHSILVQIPQLIIIVVWVNHILGCTWFAIGRLAPSDTGDRWLDSLIGVSGTDTSKTYMESEVTYQYLTAFHWALTQMTPGSMQIAAYNSSERAFSSSCLMLGILFFGSIISAVTAKMTQYRMMKQEKTTRLVSLRRFLRQHSLSKDLTVNIQKQVVERLAAPTLLTFKEVSAISLLSMRLRTELQYELCRPSFLQHPFFLLCDKVDSVAMRHLCRKVFEQIVLSSGDNLFLAGSEAENTYVVLLGEMQYTQEPESSRVTKRRIHKVAARSWLSEAALWCHWVHVGIVEAKSTAEILVINAEGALQALMQHHVMWQVTQAYGKAFHKLLQTAGPPNGVWPTDLCVPFERPEQIFRCLASDVKMFIGLFAIDTLQKSMWIRLKSIGFVQLEEEVRESKCTLMFEAETGQVVRIVAVTAVKIWHDDKVLVQLGKYKGDADVSVDCELPGTKQEENEDTIPALQRLLAGKLKPFVGALRMMDPCHKVSEGKSKTYGIHTKYMHTEHCATLSSICSMPVYKAQSDVTRKMTGWSSSPWSMAQTPTPVSSKTSDRMSAHGSLASRASIPGYDVLAVTINEVSYLYAWIQMGEFEHFRTKAGLEIVRSWLRSLDLDEDGVIRERDGYWSNARLATQECCYSTEMTSGASSPPTSPKTTRKHLPRSVLL